MGPFRDSSKWEDLLALYEGIVEADSTNWQAWFQMGIILDRCGREEDSGHAFMEAAEFSQK